MRVIAIANQKGGCGKTTTTVNLAAAFGAKGNRVLVVDLDPQGHSTLGLGCDPESFEKTIYHALVDLELPIADVIFPTKAQNVDVSPSNVLLSGAELDLATVSGREFMLSEQFKTIEDRYDVCVIDCPPSLGILTLNALIASTDLIVPVQVHYYAMEGLKQLFETCEIIQEHFYPCKVRITGLLLTFVEDRLIFTRQIEQQMREFFGDLVFDTVIHRNIRLAEAPSAGESVLTYAPDSRGAKEYLALVDEILLGREHVQGLREDDDHTGNAEQQVSKSGQAETVQPEARAPAVPTEDVFELAEHTFEQMAAQAEDAEAQNSENTNGQPDAQVPQNTTNDAPLLPGEQTEQPADTVAEKQNTGTEHNRTTESQQGVDMPLGPDEPQNVAQQVVDSEQVQQQDQNQEIEKQQGGENDSSVEQPAPTGVVAGSFDDSNPAEEVNDA